MICKTCIYFSPRGCNEDGRWKQNTDSDGTKTGWCQFNPPTGDKWPTVSEDERCAQGKEEEVGKWYIEWYHAEIYKNRILRKRIEQHEALHMAVGELGPLVGKKTNTIRLNIVKAVKAALTKNSPFVEEKPCQCTQPN